MKGALKVLTVCTLSLLFLAPQIYPAVNTNYKSIRSSLAPKTNVANSELVQPIEYNNKSILLLTPSGRMPADLSRTVAHTEEMLSESFSKGHAFKFKMQDIDISASPDGKKKIGQSVQDKISGFVSSWSKARKEAEAGNAVLQTEEDALNNDLKDSLLFLNKTIERIEDPKMKDLLKNQTRFAFAAPKPRPNTEQGDLIERELGVRPPTLNFYGKAPDKTPSLYYGEEQPGLYLGDQFAGASALGMGGIHYYDGAPSSKPRSIYIPLSRIKRYAKLASKDSEEARLLTKAFTTWLIQTSDAITTLTYGGKYVPSKEALQEIASAERIIYTDFDEEQEKYLSALGETHKNRVREYKVDAEVLRWLKAEYIPEEIEDAVKGVLLRAERQGEIKGFLVSRIGDDVSIWISHKKSTSDPFVHNLSVGAIRAGLKKAQEMGILGTILGEPDILSPNISNSDFYAALRFRTGHVLYTVRPGAEPTLRVRHFGGSRKALDLAMFNLYSNISKTTMATIEGIPGWHYVSQNLDDARADNAKIRGTQFRYPNDTDSLALELRDEDWAFSAIFPGKQSKIRMDEPVAFTFLNADYQEPEDLAKNPEARPFSPWIWLSQHSGKEAKGSTEGVLLEPQVIVGADQYRAVQPVKIYEAADKTWAKIKGSPKAIAVALESHMKADGGYDAMDLIDMLGKTTEYQDLQPLFDEMADLIQRQGPFQYALTPRFADLQADYTWEELERQGLAEPLPDRKQGELPRHWGYVRQNQLFTLTIKKGDIGGVGHGAPDPYYEPAAEASFREVASRPDSKLTDYLTFSIGDDLQFLMSHRLGPLSDQIGQYAWEGFWRSGWVAKALQLLTYGYMQDAPGAKDKNPRDEANLNANYMQLLTTELRQWAQVSDVQSYLKVNHLDIENVNEALLSEFDNPQIVKPQAVGGVVQLAGNLIGSGFGNADFVVTPWLYKKTNGEFMFLGFDKCSPAVYNSIVIEAAQRAIRDGVFSNLYVDVQGVHNDRHVLLDFQNSLDIILKLTGASSRYQLGDIFAPDEQGNLHQVGAFTTDRLFQVLMALTGKPAYGGKDDPEAIVARILGKYMIEVAKEKGFYIVLGNERGSNERLVRWTPVAKPYLGQYSDPTAAAGYFKVDENGKIVSINGKKYVDIFDSPEWERLRQEVKRKQVLIKSFQGTVGPIAAAELKLLEVAYPAVENRERALADPSRRWDINIGAQALRAMGNAL